MEYGGCHWSSCWSQWGRNTPTTLPCLRGPLGVLVVPQAQWKRENSHSDTPVPVQWRFQSRSSRCTPVGRSPAALAARTAERSRAGREGTRPACSSPALEWLEEGKGGASILHRRLSESSSRQIRPGTQAESSLPLGWEEGGVVWGGQGPWRGAWDGGTK